MQEILQEYGDEIRFICAFENDVLCWFYIKIPPEKLDAYLKKLELGDIEIRDYGQILESDIGEYPPGDVIRFMKDEYGFITPPKSYKVD